MNTTDLIDEFDQIVLLSKDLSASLILLQRPCWVPIAENESFDQELHKAARYYQDYWYQGDQDGRETRSCFGLISGTQEQVILARAINGHKARFKKLVGDLKKQDSSGWLDLKGQLNKRHADIHEQLHFSGQSRLHLKQTWRTLPVLDRRPHRVGMNWYTSGRSINKITVEQAQAALEQMDTGAPHIVTQLAQLGNLPANTPLARVQNQAPTMRANFMFDDSVEPQRLAMNVSLPVLFLDEEDKGLPVHNVPEFEAPEIRKRAVRSDRKIEDEPFLPSIRTHLYTA